MDYPKRTRASHDPSHDRTPQGRSADGWGTALLIFLVKNILMTILEHR